MIYIMIGFYPTVVSLWTPSKIGQSSKMLVRPSDLSLRYQYLIYYQWLPIDLLIVTSWIDESWLIMNHLDTVEFAILYGNYTKSNIQWDYSKFAIILASFSQNGDEFNINRHWVELSQIWLDDKYSALTSEITLNQLSKQHALVCKLQHKFANFIEMRCQFVTIKDAGASNWHDNPERVFISY